MNEIKFEEQQYCCSSCAAKRRCSICDGVTTTACSDCAIDLRAVVYVCNKRECRDAHSEKCPHDLRAKVAALEAENGRLRAAVSDAECETLNRATYYAMGATLDRLIPTFNALITARAQQPSPAQDKEQPMTDIKSIPSMSKAELVKEVERLVALVRVQSAAMAELGKLSDTQQARIAELEQAREGDEV